MKRIYSFFIVFILFVTSLFCEIRYIEIDSIKNVPVIEIKSIDDFEAIIYEYGIKIGYLQKSVDTIQTGRRTYDGLTLYIIVDSTYFSFPMKGYLTLSDYKNGTAKKFENGSDYNKAIALGFDSAEIYYYYKQNSFSSVEDCKEAYENGFVNTRDPNNYGSRSDDSLAYYNAKSLGYSKYSDYRDYLDYTSKGFKNKSDWQIARVKGFDKGNDYYVAIENGFSDYPSYKAACSVGLTTNNDYQNYYQIVSSIEQIMKEKNLEKKNAVIFYYIQNIPKGEMAISALSIALIESYNSQSEKLLNALNIWYVGIRNELQKSQQSRLEYSKNSTKKIGESTNIFSQKALSDFFNIVDIGTLGSYNSKSQIFRRK